MHTVPSTPERRPDTVGEWVAERPSRSRIFEKAGIDYCCGGNRGLEEAARAAGCDAAALRAELEAAPAAGSDRDWRRATMRELVDHIVRAHHEWLRENLPRLSQLAGKTAQAHGAHELRVREIQAEYEALRADLEPHLLKEEAILFPAALRWSETGEPPFGCHGAPGLEGPLEVMESDHRAVGGMLERLVALTDGFEPPPEACNTWRALYDALRELDANTRAHIHLENEVLHPAIRALAGRKAPTAPADYRTDGGKLG